jgi:hypothetical protein
MITHIIIIGIVAGLVGIFYRNCLKGDGMIFNSIYNHILKPMFESKYSLLRFISMPLGYCVYCSTFWIGVLLYVLYNFHWLFVSPAIRDIPIIIFDLLVIAGISHLVVLVACKYLIKGHPDFDDDYVRRNQLNEERLSNLKRVSLNDIWYEIGEESAFNLNEMNPVYVDPHHKQTIIDFNNSITWDGDESTKVYYLDENGDKVPLDRSFLIIDNPFYEITSYKSGTV